MKKEDLVKNELTNIQKLLVMLNLFGFKIEESIGTTSGFCEYKLSTFLYGIDDKIISNLMKIFSEKIKSAGFCLKYIESNLVNNHTNISSCYITICFYAVDCDKDFHKKIGSIEKISKELAVQVTDEIISYKDMLGLFSEKDAEEIKCFFDVLNKKCVIKPDRGFFKLEF